MILDGVKNLGGFHRLPRPLTTSSTGDGVSECAERAEPDLRGPLRRDRKPAPRKPRDFELRCLLRSDNMSGLCKHVKERVLILITAQQGCSETTNGFQDESQIPRIEAELVDFRNFRDTALSDATSKVEYSISENESMDLNLKGGPSESDANGTLAYDCDNFPVWQDPSPKFSCRYQKGMPQRSSHRYRASSASVLPQRE
ncbi:hypothetical protein BDDG_07951 [Blastomyces dermatitidis ATCC 18188]|uniref:Uncharacterized protein n=1 Tax=Ajellomyces dermatitidis (strain ATCC 18188 / CBS 674.68) TaxID=653446 RepID=F2TP43_AJEDA|nr:hypothetical protein BDDG_07951 [Blastomyces dermatitidis ATCC 18188]